MSTLTASVAAIGSALSYAIASVVQYRAARQAPKGAGLHLGLLAHLATRPLWLAGLVADTTALALHAVALSAGELALVQPLLVSGLLFALPASVLLERRRPSLAEWSWALILIAALAAFLTVGQPSIGHAPTDTDRLAALTVAGTIATGLVIVVCAQRVFARHRAALLGLAGGIAFGLTAALLKETTTIGTGSHPFDVLSSWTLYALVAIGAAALILNQAAFQAGPLAASLPPLTMVDPVIAIALGLLVFNETLAHNAAALTIETLSFAVMALAVVQLARRSSTEPRSRRDHPSHRGRRTTSGWSI